MAKDIAGQSALAFLNAELQTGLTLAHMALRASRQEKKARNLINALKAYEAILHYLPQSNLSTNDAKQVNTRLEELRSALRDLGENL